MKINPNEPIMPIPYTNSDGSIQHDIYKGLTKREHFAGLAMQGLLTRVPQRHNGEADLGILESQRIAEESVIMADKIIAELNRTQV